jgi:hypothetical protein
MAKKMLSAQLNDEHRLPASTVATIFPESRPIFDLYILQIRGMLKNQGFVPFVISLRELGVKP